MIAMRIPADNIAAFGISRRPGGRGGLQTELMQMRLQERQRELQMREKENERIKLLTERMSEVKNSDMEWNIKQNTIESLTNQINQIYKNRAEREIMTAEREMMRQKAVVEEATQVREEVLAEAEDDDNIQGLTRLAVTQDRISTLQQTRATLAQEAGHIERAIYGENSNYILIGSGHGVETIIGGQTGLGADDYRNQQLAKLNLGIARTDAAINQAVASMYRESARVQEGWLEENKEVQDRPRYDIIEDE